MPPWELAKGKWELPAGRGKLSPGLLPSTSVLGSISAGNVPFHSSPPGLGLSLTPLGAGCQCLITSPGRDLCPGGIPVLGTDISLVLFPFPTLILDGKAWWYLRLGGEAEQAVRERPVTQNSGEFGPIPPFSFLV